MTIDQAKQLVIKAGLRLVETGLIARTWGNISCRLDEDSFFITPSGRDYTTLTPDEIVEVNISDCSYEGEVKPSSEKGIHGDVYKLFPDINFVIHTHQENASVVGATGLNFMAVEGENAYLGDRVICAAYSLPGTKSLRRNVSQALQGSSGKAVIMKYHGALCIGEDYKEAFTVASELENACGDFIWDKHMKLGDPYDLQAEIIRNDFVYYPNSKRTENGFVLYYKDKEVEYQLEDINDSLPMEVMVYDGIYDKYPHINYILFKSTPEINALAGLNMTLKPMLDDFAQIVGPRAKTVENDEKKIVDALKRSSAVFIQKSGVLCCGSSEEDALAIGMVTEKGTKAYLGASLFGKPKAINAIESILMRFVYLQKYSKQIDK